MATSLHILETIQILNQTLQVETTTFDASMGPITQSIWTMKEQEAIKAQIRGLLKQIPEPQHFSNGMRQTDEEL